MLRSYKTLSKKAADNVKKQLAKREKAKKLRRSKKKELNKALAEKRNELYRRNQEHMLALIAMNKNNMDSDM
jgi:hypothetical protein